MSEPVLILGAGLAGLSCARHLDERAIVLERESSVGGVARSFERQGFHFDCTGHWLHLRDDGIRTLVDALLGVELTTIERRAEVHSHGVRTPYPFQANTYGLPTEVVAECVLGYFAAREEQAAGRTGPARSFEDFIRQRMGDGIARHFMIPYNSKLYTVPPSEMDYAWCDRFVPIPKPQEVVLGAIQPGGANQALGYNATFRYPRQGGIGQLAERLAAKLTTEIRRNVDVRRVDWKRREVTLNDGSALSYEALVSTAPLSDLAAMLVDPPEAVIEAGQKLRAASVTYWDVGVAGKNGPNDAHWTYFPEPDFPFYRVGSASAASPAVAPDGHRSYYVEVAHARGTTCPSDEQAVLDGLRTAGLLGAEEVPVLMHRTTIDCAYVIMDKAYGKARALLLTWLQEQRVLSVGRYGAWTYDSMEGAMVQGRRAADTVLELL